jgi:hypothetical protein
VDPIGTLLSRLLAGVLGYALGSRQERTRTTLARLNDERVQAVANRT